MMGSKGSFRATLAAVAATLLALPAAAVIEIQTLSNRADLISGGDALVEIVLNGEDPTGMVVDVDGNDVSGDFALRANNRYMGSLTGLAVGPNVVTATLAGGGGATLTIDNHPPEGPVFTGPHLQPWDCRTSQNGLGAGDANCNAPPVVEWFCSTGGGFSSCDPQNPPGNLETLTIDGESVRAIVRQETGAVNRGIYTIAVLHDPAEPQAPWIRQDGWTGKLYYPFFESCNINHTQGNAENVLITNRLKAGFAVATNSLNRLGHHCNPILSAETAMMTKEILIERYGQVRWTISTGLSGGAIGQLQVSNAYPGITNGLQTDEMFADTWSTGFEVGDCLLLEAYWGKSGLAYTQFQKSAIDGHGPAQTSCAAWIGTFALSGLAANGCFSGSTIPTTSTPEARDYNPVTNRGGCRASVQDIQFNVWGPRLEDGFSKRPLDNRGVQYGLNAVNRPTFDSGNITFAQFLDLNRLIGGVNIDGVATVPRPGQTVFPRTRTDAEVPEFVYRTGNINDGEGLKHAAILNFTAAQNVEIHTPYHAYALEARMAKIGHEDNHTIWHNGGQNENAWNTMVAWLDAIEAAGGIDPLTGLMDPQTIKDERPATVFDSCWSGSTQSALSNCAGQVYGDARLEAGMDLSHDNLKCQLKPIDPADYAGAVPAPTQVELDQLAEIFPNGVCDYSVEAVDKAPSVPWLTYENGPGGEPLGAWPTSTGF